MVALATVHASNAHIVRTYPLIAVIVGGTAGIGASTVRAFASIVSRTADSKGVRVYIVGRNQTAAKTLINECQDICLQSKDSEFIFVKARDLSLLKDVDKVCNEIIEAEMERPKIDGLLGPTRVDFLLLSQGILTFTPSTTTEGLDHVMSLDYYSRARFCMQLLPLLTASVLPSGARIVSVLNPRFEGKLVLDDLACRKKESQGFMTMSSHIALLTIFFFENLAKRCEGRISATHIHPGIVLTGAVDTGKLPGWFVLLWKWVLEPCLRPWSLSFEECGARIIGYTSPRFPGRAKDGSEHKKTVGIEEDRLEVAVAADGVAGGGAYKTKYDGETIPNKKAYHEARKMGMYESAWEHTMKIFDHIEKKGMYEG